MDSKNFLITAVKIVGDLKVYNFLEKYHIFDFDNRVLVSRISVSWAAEFASFFEVLYSLIFFGDEFHPFIQFVVLQNGIVSGI